MPFYPDEGAGDDLEIEHKYNIDDRSLEEKSDDDSDSLIIKSNKKKIEPVSGIDHQELKKRIESFTLNNDEEDEESFDSAPSAVSSEPNGQDDASTSEEDIEEEDIIDDIIVEDEEGVPSIKDFEVDIIPKIKDTKVDSLEKEYVFLESKISKPLKSFKNNKKSISNETLNWYMKISGLPIFLITLYSMLVLGREYLITISSNLTSFAQNMYWFDSMKWPFEILVFLFVTYIIIRREKQLPRIAGITCVIIGFSAGVIIAVIKLFWYREMWNIFYLSAESIFLGLTGLVVGLLASAVFYEEYQR